jgi:C4-dicarboxylate-specific signal transduction histidine kinase
MHRLTLSLIAVVVALAISATAWLISRSRAENERNVELTLQYQAQLFEAFARNLLGSFDQALTLLRGEVIENGPRMETVEWASRRGLLSGPIFQFAIIDRNGRLAATTEGPSNVGIDLSDREHFRVHLDRASDRMFISRPLVGRASGRWSINISRAVIDSSGSFLGVVVLSVDPESFSGFLEILGEAEGTIVSLVGRDLVIRARASSDAAVQAIGTSVAGFEFARQVDRAASGVYRTTSGVDGIERLYGFRRLDDLGLVVAVGLESDVAFRNFYALRDLYLLLSAGFTAMLAGLLLLGERYLAAAQRVRVHQALAAHSERLARELNLVMDGCGAALVRVDHAGRIQSCNTVFRTMFRHHETNGGASCSFAEIMGGGSDAAAVPDRFKDVLNATQFPVRYEMSIVEPDAARTRRDVMWSWTRSASADNAGSSYIGVAIDNTDLRAKELLLIQASKLASLGRLAATLNHEMVQPLNVLRLSLRNLQTELEKGAARDAMAARLQRTLDTTARIGDILARFRSLVLHGRDTVTTFPVADAIAAALAMYEEQLRIDSIDIRFDHDPTHLATGNRTELEQVFVNLVANAREAVIASRRPRRSGHAQEDSPNDWIRISFDRDGAREDFVRVYVEDNGGGVPNELAGRIFQPFFTTKSDGGGTGLGLAICRATVERFGGSLDLVNTPTGARFIVGIPVVGRKANPAAIESKELST